jgi:thioesterase domain-containing protein
VSAEPDVRLVPLGRPGGRPPLLLISAPEVNTLGYVALARRLDPRESPISVETRRTGVGPRQDEYSLAEMAALSARYLSAVRAAHPEGPYFLAGMCDGAHLAFEMARNLSAAGARVALLALLDTWPVENSAHYPLVVLEALRARYARVARRGRLTAAAGVLAAALRRLGPPSEEQRRWRDRVFPGAGFEPPVYGGRITVIRAERQAYYRLRDETLGWGARSSLPVDVCAVPGDHAGLLRLPAVAEVARVIQARLDAARKGAREAA